MKTRLCTCGFAVLALGLPAAAWAQGVASATPAQPTTREAIDAQFRREVEQAERGRIGRLAALAATQPRADASQTYVHLFRLASSAGLYSDAEPIAERVLHSGEAPVKVAMLAEMINLVAEANRGAYEDSLNSLRAALRIRADADKADPKAKVRQALPLAARLSLVDVYTQRLIQSGKYDVARKALSLIYDEFKEPAIKALAASRLDRLDLVGKPAPPIAGTSVDGKEVRLSDFKGEVVLVVFWASWCLSTGDDADQVNLLEAAFRDKGFRVLDINLDSVQDGGVPVETVMPNIRRFLLDHNVSFPNLINGQGGRDYARAYGVTEVPANVLIGRDGKVLHLDLGRSNLESAIAAALAR